MAFEGANNIDQSNGFVSGWNINSNITLFYFYLKSQPCVFIFGEAKDILPSSYLLNSASKINEHVLEDDLSVKNAIISIHFSTRSCLLIS